MRLAKVRCQWFVRTANGWRGTHTFGRVEIPEFNMVAVVVTRCDDGADFKALVSRRSLKLSSISIRSLDTQGQGPSFKDISLKSSAFP